MLKPLPIPPLPPPSSHPTRGGVPLSHPVSASSTSAPGDTPHLDILGDAADGIVEGNDGRGNVAGRGTQGRDEGGTSAKISGICGTQSTGARGTSAKISGARGTQFVQGPRGTSAKILDSRGTKPNSMETCLDDYVLDAYDCRHGCSGDMS